MNKRNCKQTKEAQIIETIDNMNLLNYAVAHGIINLDDVRKNAMNEQRQHYLSMHKYSIFQDKKDGRWKTTIPDSTKKTGRRLVANKNRSDLENEIINYYKSIGYSVFINTQIDKIREIFKDKVSILTGQTGVGKSSLINKLEESMNLKTMEIIKLQITIYNNKEKIFL